MTVPLSEVVESERAGARDISAEVNFIIVSNSKRRRHRLGRMRHLS